MKSKLVRLIVMKQSSHTLTGVFIPNCGIAQVFALHSSQNICDPHAKRWREHVRGAERRGSLRCTRVLLQPAEGRAGARSIRVPDRSAGSGDGAQKRRMHPCTSCTPAHPCPIATRAPPACQCRDAALIVCAAEGAARRRDARAMQQGRMARPRHYRSCRVQKAGGRGTAHAYLARS